MSADRAVLALLSPALRAEIERYVEGRSVGQQQQVYDAVLRLLNEGVRQASDNRTATLGGPAC